MLLRHRVLPVDVKKTHLQFHRIANAIRGAQTLALGDRGAAVEALQRQLRGVGAYHGPLNGTFDAATQAAVKQLQSGKHLASTGVVDSKELAALEAQQRYVKSGFVTH